MMQEAPQIGALGRAVAHARSGGIRNLCFKALAVHSYRRLWLLERPLDLPNPAVEARVPVRFGVLGEDEFEAYADFSASGDSPLTLAEVRERVERGEICFTAHRDGVLVSAKWGCVGSHRIGYVRHTLKLAADEFYLYDTFSLPSVRGQRISPALTEPILDHYRTAGFRRLIGTVEPENAASRRALSKLGYRVYAKVGFVRLGPWVRTFETPADGVVL